LMMTKVEIVGMRSTLTELLIILLKPERAESAGAVRFSGCMLSGSRRAAILRLVSDKRLQNKQGKR